MPWFANRARLCQPALFHPPHRPPSLQSLPPAIQKQMIQLLAQLLRGHLDRMRAAGHAQEAGDE